MSDTASLATVTAALQGMLMDMTSATDVTTTSPASSSNQNSSPHLNIYLYSTAINSAFSNTPFPGQIKNGESIYPPLALTLKYLISTYGDTSNDLSAHQLMGEAMRVLHDHPLLGKDDLQGVFSGSNLHEQIEHIHITMDPISLDDMSKLWTSFQAEYRLSTGYEVSVVFIDSNRPSRTPLPVLTRGKKDKGIVAQANVIPPFPTITGFNLPNQQQGIELGSQLIIEGHHLEADTTIVSLEYPQKDITIRPILESTSSEQITFTLNETDIQYEVGVVQVKVSLISTDEEGNERTLHSNQLTLPIAPKISNLQATSSGSGITLTLDCVPSIDPEQETYLLLSDKQIRYKPTSTDGINHLEFTIPNINAGTYYARLRVDGIDSFLIPDRGAQPPEFDANAKVVVS